MISEKDGDLFTSDAAVIGHGVNCCGVMGKGIAVAFKYAYPDMYEQYVKICALGLLIPGEVYLYRADDGKFIANMATQDKPGPNARYEWIVSAVGKTLDLAKDYGLSSVAIPRVGAGIGGLKWENTMYLLIDKYHDHPVDLEVWTYRVDL